MLYSDKQPSFQDIFATYCDINDIVITPSRKELIDIIVSQKFTSVITYHKWWFLRYYFDKLIKKEISMEQFMTMWDIEWQIEDQINPHIYQEENSALLKNLNPDKVFLWNKDEIIILDKLVYFYYSYKYDKLNTEATIILID